MPITLNGSGVISGDVQITGALKDASNSAGTSGQALTSTGSATQWGNLLTKPTIVVATTNTTIASNTYCYVPNPNLTITLPASPAVGDVVTISVANFSSTVAGRNGNLIEGLAEDLIINVPGASIDLIYVSNTLGWMIK